MKRFMSICFILLVLASVFKWVVPLKAAESMENIGDKVSIMGNMKLDKQTLGSVVAVFGDLSVNETVNGSVMAVFGNVKIDSIVNGNVVALAGKVELTDRALVNGNLISLGEKNIQPGAKIQGQEINVATGTIVFAQSMFSVVSAVFVLILGLGIISMFKDRFANISLGSDYEVKKRFKLGFLGLLGLTLLMLLLFVTMIVPVIYFIITLAAEVTACIYIGKKVLRVVNIYFSVYTEFVLGLILTTILKIAISFIIPGGGIIAGGLLYLLIMFAICALGVGILIDTKFGSNPFKGF